jgi:hypothetical protein
MNLYAGKLLHVARTAGVSNMLICVASIHRNILRYIQQISLLFSDRTSIGLVMGRQFYITSIRDCNHVSLQAILRTIGNPEGNPSHHISEYRPRKPSGVQIVSYSQIAESLTSWIAEDNGRERIDVTYRA